MTGVQTCALPILQPRRNCRIFVSFFVPTPCDDYLFQSKVRCVPWAKWRPLRLHLARFRIMVCHLPVKTPIHMKCCMFSASWWVDPALGFAVGHFWLGVLHLFDIAHPGGMGKSFCLQLLSTMSKHLTLLLELFLCEYLHSITWSSYWLYVHQLVRQWCHSPEESRDSCIPLRVTVPVKLSGIQLLTQFYYTGVVRSV